MRIRTKRTFSGVPAGTEGECEREQDPKAKRPLWKITWDMPGRAKPLVDWFSQDEKEQFLEEI